MCGLEFLRALIHLHYSCPFTASGPVQCRLVLTQFEIAVLPKYIKVYTDYILIFAFIQLMKSFFLSTASRHTNLVSSYKLSLFWYYDRELYAILELLKHRNFQTRTNKQSNTHIQHLTMVMCNIMTAVFFFSWVELSLPGKTCNSSGAFVSWSGKMCLSDAKLWVSLKKMKK